MPSISLCRCCGVPVEGLRRKFRVCPMCDACDGVHGDALQARCAALVASGQISPWLALTRMIVDDALLCGRLVFIGDPHAALIVVLNPPKRWEVVVCRALCKSELPELQVVIDAVLGAFMGHDASPPVLEALRAEMIQAMHAVDPSLFDVEVIAERDPLDPEHVRINVSAKTPGLPAAYEAADVDMPADILSRPRGLA